MGNPNPSPSTRFGKGNNANPKGGPPGPQLGTILRALPAVRPLGEVLADINAWQGTEREFVESVMRDASNPLDIRLACADRLMRRQEAVAGKDATAPRDAGERDARIAALLGKGLASAALTIDAD